MEGSLEWKSNNGKKDTRKHRHCKRGEKKTDVKGKELLCRMSSLLIRINIYGKLKARKSLLLEKAARQET